MERPKLELELQKPTKITLLFDDCIEGSSKYGKYYLYAVTNGDGQKEFSLFASEQVHEKLKYLKRGDSAIITKTASQKGNKIVLDYSTEVIKATEVPPQETPKQQRSPNQPNSPITDEDYFYFAMEKSFSEAIKLQGKFNGMANVNQIAITLFIQRTKGNHSFTN